jgi:hypothetical protein
MALTLQRVLTRLLPQVEKGRALSRSEFATLVRTAEVLMEDAPADVSPEDIAKNVEQFLIDGRSRRAWRVRILLRVIELAPVPHFGRRFSRLTSRERRAFILENWVAGGRLGRICGKVKNLVVLGAYGDPRAAARTGYVPVHRRRRFLDKGQQPQERIPA